MESNCINCNKSFPNNSLLEMHGRFCNKQNIPIVCKHPLLINENLLNNQISSEENITCELCNKVFSLDNIEDYMNHVQNQECLDKNFDNHSNVSNLYSDEEPQQNFVPMEIDDNNDIEDEEEDGNISEGSNNYDEENENDGIPEHQLSTLNKETYKQIPNIDSLCYICYDNMIDNDNVIRLPCLHVYHELEIMKWLKSNSKCPQCRLDVKEHI